MAAEADGRPIVETFEVVAGFAGLLRNCSYLPERLLSVVQVARRETAAPRPSSANASPWAFPAAWLLVRPRVNSR